MQPEVLSISFCLIVICGSLVIKSRVFYRGESHRCWLVHLVHRSFSKGSFRTNAVSVRRKLHTVDVPSTDPHVQAAGKGTEAPFVQLPYENGIR